jgi:hypothetical protein
MIVGRKEQKKRAKKEKQQKAYENVDVVVRKLEVISKVSLSHRNSLGFPRLSLILV